MLNNLSYKQWLVPSFCLLTLCLIIWFIGPLISISSYEVLSSTMSRIIFIFFISFFWLGYIIFKVKMKTKIEDESIRTLLQVDELQDKEAASEISILKKKIETAIKIINNKNGKNNLYYLPWYVMIGPPGSGKTTALLHSGLEFPLQEKMGSEVVSGVGGTRHCDWWFSNEAVLIDTAGRYTTQDSQEKVDSKAWHGFLGLLKKHRKESPINGAIVTVDLPSMITKTKIERSLHARAIKSRLQELKNQLGLNYPVYVILTKSDLISGFQEFFSLLDESERNQILGIIFPMEVQNSKGVISNFNREYHDLLESLEHKMLKLLDLEESLEKRALIFGFPKQLRLLQSNLDLFLKDIFNNNDFEDPMMIRGIFFISSTQEGIPFNKLESEISSNMGLAKIKNKNINKDVSFFINHVFTNVIFREKYLGNLDNKNRTKNLIVRKSYYFSCIVIICITTFFWLYSYNWNEELINRTSISANKISNKIKDQSNNEYIYRNVSILNDIYEMSQFFNLELLNARIVGLYQGDKINQSTIKVYNQALDLYLSKFIQEILESEMVNNYSNREYLYETLKIYLMLFINDELNREEVIEWLYFYLENNYKGDHYKKMVNSIIFHTNKLLDRDDKGLIINDKLVSKVRGVLTEMSLSERAYQIMKIKYIKSNIKDFNLMKVWGVKGDKYFSRKSGRSLSEGIPGFYTYSGYHSIFQIKLNSTIKDLIEENWVYGDNISIENIDYELAIENVRQRYYSDFINEWEALLKDIKLNDTKSIESKSEQIKYLSGKDKPLEKLIIAIKKEVELTKVNLSNNKGIAGELATNVAKVKLSKTTDKLSLYTSKNIESMNLNINGIEVESEFEELIKLNESDLSQLDISLDNVDDYFDDFLEAKSLGSRKYNNFINSGSINDMTRAIKNINYILPNPFNTWLTDVSSESIKISENGAKSHLNKVWENNVYKICRKSIVGRYPFKSNSKYEVRLKDFEKFFSYGGILDSFFNEYLEPFVDKSGRYWTFDKDIGLKNSSLRIFQKGEKIREDFFELDNNLNVEYSLKPLYLDQHIIRFEIQFGSQELIYKHGPIKSTKFTWPSNEPLTRIVFTPRASSREVSYTYESEWGIFKLLDTSLQLRTESSDDYVIEVELKGNNSRLKLIPSSSIHPFWSNSMENFKCPKSL